ncbi:hypothetical protein L5515_012245 [Caenorhabditis briggsae]|uniref:SUN domain-containing protein n=1 Tax=Caenorhabditis briggsae TaxID=6238 RepID=A0AAE9EXP7_CAEBR|nr:hypothetical protein L5515_012245 [Caenorhabditis briggsae]
MNRVLLLLFFLLVGIWCNHPVSSEEKQYWNANCGTKPYHPRRFESRKIAGGQPLNGYEAPWAVRLESAGLCSGTIISPRHILTASHYLLVDKSKLTPILQQANQTCSYKWISNRIRQYMIPEIFYFISLVLILYRLQTLSNQNDRVLETVNSMQSKFANMERKIESLVSQKPNQDISPFDNTEPLEQSIANVLKSMKTPEQDSIEKMEPIIPQSKQGTTKTAESTSEVSVSKEQYRFNATDYLKRVSVDNDYSSSSNLNPIIGYDQTNLVLLDRPEPPADKAWCSNTQNPVLSINLAKYIKPISVSYQHSKWNGTIPNGAPRTYDVVACLDFYCKKWKPLVSNCQYSRYESKGTEQVCNISSHLDVPLIGKVQFRFRENYGDTKTTCVHLVRVHGESKTPLKNEEKKLKSEEICTDLRWYNHNNFFKLYNNSCCSECPECCEECLISDYNGRTLGNIAGYTMFSVVIGMIAILVLLIVCSLIMTCYQCCTGKQLNES